MTVFDDTACLLGEGPLWHPLRSELFWFDILGQRLHAKGQSWDFDTYVSAAGWVDEDTLLVASATALSRFDLRDGTSTEVVALEADNPVTRSNDGRADAHGGFWIGTMGINAEPKAGAIYRFYRGELRQIIPDITISNSICFAPDGETAYYADTPTRQIMRQALDPHTGWPAGAAEVFVDLRDEGLNPDGSVVDADGNLWNAQWGASRVACYDPTGRFLHAVDLPASQITCPAFGDADLRTLYVTSAADGVDEAEGGKTFCLPVDVAGQREHQVIL